MWWYFFFFFQAEDGIRDIGVTGVQTCALPICIGKNLADRNPKTRRELCEKLGGSRSFAVSLSADQYAPAPFVCQACNTTYCACLLGHSQDVDICARVWKSVNRRFAGKNRGLFLPSTQLSGERAGLLGEIFREHKILRPHRFVGLPDETLRGVVLRARVGVQRAIVHAIQIGGRLRQRRPNRSLD